MSLRLGPGIRVEARRGNVRGVTLSLDVWDDEQDEEIAKAFVRARVILGEVLHITDIMRHRV